MSPSSKIRLEGPVANNTAPEKRSHVKDCFSSISGEGAQGRATYSISGTSSGTFIKVVSVSLKIHAQTQTHTNENDIRTHAVGSERRRDQSFSVHFFFCIINGVATQTVEWVITSMKCEKRKLLQMTDNTTQLNRTATHILPA